MEWFRSFICHCHSPPYFRPNISSRYHFFIRHWFVTYFIYIIISKKNSPKTFHHTSFMGCCQTLIFVRRKTLQETYLWNVKKLHRRKCRNCDGSRQVFLLSMIGEFNRIPFKDLLQIDEEFKVSRKSSMEIIEFHELLHKYIETRLERYVIPNK